jgi:hypothetical protein
MHYGIIGTVNVLCLRIFIFVRMDVCIFVCTYECLYCGGTV